MNRHANTLAVSPRYASQAGFLVLAKNVFAVAGQSRPYSTHSTTPKAGFRNAPLHLVLLGAPGAGKGTQTDTLLRKYPLNALVVGNLLRDQVSRKSELGKQAAKIMKAGGLLDDATILQVVKPELHKMIGTDWILVSLSCHVYSCKNALYILGKRFKNFPLYNPINPPFSHFR